ncbi:MipA/OmpV family protein [Inhella proteolytica]|uniref:MipA/OmpV family protein n=1 Tax=Inhella proteolytica TaxID=2795029 RepID=A0A931J8W5_9BURK|nr:MipA/OmpV family protein [Inhella proteolytica]MBH9579704.1 MipA/OmpV family protein [Inhella proteolytica]
MRNTAPQRAALLLVAALMTGPAAAEDIGRELRRGESAEGNYLELGLGLRAANGPKRHGLDADPLGLAAIINGCFQWKGVFIENHAEDAHGLVLGYGLVEQPDWSLDLLLTSKHQRTRHEGAAWRVLDTQADRVAGLRLSGTAGAAVWQFNAWKDVSGRHDGFGASAQLGRAWQHGNWNLHALAGLNYSSAKVLDYYHGVSAQQSAVTGLAAYRAGAGWGGAAEVGASYPLARDWVLRSTLRAIRNPSTVRDSSRWSDPKRTATSLLLSVSHVF